MNRPRFCSVCGQRFWVLPLRYAFLCENSNSNCPEEPDVKFGQWDDTQPPKRKHITECRGELFGLIPRRQIRCGKCGDPAYIQVCFRCHRLVPSRAKGALTIAIGGLSGAGKTATWKALYQGLKAIEARPGSGLTVFRVNKAAQDLLGGNLEPTRATDAKRQEPPIVHLGIEARRPGSGACRGIRLVWHDVAGEILQGDAGRLGQYAQHLRRADGLILVVNPWHDGQLRDALGAPGGIAMPPAKNEDLVFALGEFIREGRSGIRALGDVIRGLRSGSRDGPLNLPTAVLVVRLDEVLPNAIIRYPNPQIPYGDVEDEIVRLPIRLEEWRATSLATAISSRFAPARIFGATNVGMEMPGGGRAAPAGATAALHYLLRELGAPRWNGGP